MLEQLQASIDEYRHDHADDPTVFIHPKTQHRVEYKAGMPLRDIIGYDCVADPTIDEEDFVLEPEDISDRREIFAENPPVHHIKQLLDDLEVRQTEVPRMRTVEGYVMFEVHSVTYEPDYEKIDELDAAVRDIEHSQPFRDREEKFVKKIDAESMKFPVTMSLVGGIETDELKERIARQVKELICGESVGHILGEYTDEDDETQHAIVGKKTFDLGRLVMRRQGGHE